MGLDPQEAFTKRDETHDVQNSVAIQIVKLNPISEKEASKERMRGEREPLEEECEEKYPEACGWSGDDFRTAARVSARLFFRMPIFSVLASSLSPTLVWTQFPTVGVSASAVLAFFVVAPPAAPTTVELLLPMKVALNKNFTGMGGRRDAS
jgi:hypothetical protein